MAYYQANSQFEAEVHLPAITAVAFRMSMIENQFASNDDSGTPLG